MAQSFEPSEASTPLLIIFLSALFLPLFLLIFKYFISLSASKRAPLPPGPTPWPIIGNIPHLLGKMLHVALAEYSTTYGPLLSLRLGTQFIVVGSSPAAALEILKVNDRVLSGRYVPNAVAISSKEELDHTTIGWASECHDRWKYFRGFLRTELFSNTAMESHACTREAKVLEMVEFLKTKEGEVVNIGDLVSSTVFNALSNVLVSKDLTSLGEERVDDGINMLVKKIGEVVSAPNISDLFPILGRFDLQGLRKKLKEVQLRIASKWKSTVEERRRRRKDGFSTQQDILETLLDNDFTDDQINQLFAELFAAGTDTVVLTIEWAMAELLKHQECMKKVHEELKREIVKDYVTESQVMQLTYLQACIKETLRLHPAAPLLIPHRAIETCNVMTHTIPKDALIMVNVWAIGRDPLIWEQPLSFRPERFLSSPLDYKGNNFEFLPFGAGRRICPGLPLASKTVPLIVASLVHFFDWKVPQITDPSKLDMSEKLGVTLHKEQPLLLVPKTRK